MKIIKFDQIKRENETFLDIKVDLSTSTDLFEAYVYCHRKPRLKIEISDLFEIEDSVGTAFINTRDIGLEDTTVVVLVMIDKIAVEHFAISTDIKTYYPCVHKALMKDVVENTSGHCNTNPNTEYLRLISLYNAFYDANCLGDIRGLFSIANMLDKLCNIECKSCCNV